MFNQFWQHFVANIVIPLANYLQKLGKTFLYLGQRWNSIPNTNIQDFFCRKLDHTLGNVKCKLPTSFMSYIYFLIFWKPVEIFTFAKIVCFPFNSSARPRVKKNWLRLSFWPVFAMATKPRLTNLNLWWISS